MEISLENLHVYKVLPYVPVRIPSKSQKKKKAFAQFGLESGMVLRELRE